MISMIFLIMSLKTILIVRFACNWMVLNLEHEHVGAVIFGNDRDVFEGTLAYRTYSIATVLAGHRDLQLWSKRHGWSADWCVVCLCELPGSGGGPTDPDYIAVWAIAASHRCGSPSGYLASRTAACGGDWP